ncbi:MAG: response regulator transcription factor [Deltaproteobacteria bacterium]|nr:response regulator transcription factor [Deltaproteobacteria bacterium]
MTRIMLVSKDPASMEGLAGGLENHDDVEVVNAVSRQEVLERVEEGGIDVVVVDVQLKDTEPLTLVTELMKKQPLINYAMVSSLSHEDFHEYSEGLGVFMQLPLSPGEREAGEMLEILKSINLLLKV